MLRLSLFTMVRPRPEREERETRREVQASFVDGPVVAFD